MDSEAMEACHSAAEEIVRLIQSSDGMSKERFDRELSVILRQWSVRNGFVRIDEDLEEG